MQLLAHRGVWTDSEARNSEAALTAGLRRGFGIETDLRDQNGLLVVSHDPPVDAQLSARRFFETVESTCPTAPLAINVKADGIQAALRRLTTDILWENSFVFDMSIPDTLGFLDGSIPVYVRQSEYEPAPPFLAHPMTKGIWLDAFQQTWWDADVVLRHLDAGRRVAIVSPELHGRDPAETWELVEKSDLHRHPDVLLCTDLPDDALELFGDAIAIQPVRAD